MGVGDETCSAEECGSEESSLLALHSAQRSETRRRYPTVWCLNVNGDQFPCEGGSGGCCGNACYAPGSKCCMSSVVPRSRWYPVSKETECDFGADVDPTTYPSPYQKGQIPYPTPYPTGQYPESDAKPRQKP